MAEWYASSTIYASLPVFQVSTAYNLNDIVTPTAPAAGREWTFICTVAGTTASSEPGWPTANNATVTSGTATFKSVGGQSAYAWNAPTGSLGALIQNAGIGGSDRAFGGDTIWLDSTNVESNQSTYFGGVDASYVPLRIISVDASGTVPPGPMDLLAGAQVGPSGAKLLLAQSSTIYVYGIFFQGSGIDLGGNLASPYKITLDTCELSIVGGSSTTRIASNASANQSIELINTAVRFSHVSQGFGISSTVRGFTWTATENALLGDAPTTLFYSSSSNGYSQVTVRGVDLSAAATNLVAGATTTNPNGKYLFDGCLLSAAVNPYTGVTVNGANDEVALVGCFSGGSSISGLYTAWGSSIIDRTTFSTTDPAEDDESKYSYNMTSNGHTAPYGAVLTAFPVAVKVASGLLVTATLEILGTVTLTNDDLVLTAEYLGTSGSYVRSFADSAPATPMSLPVNLSTSTESWTAPGGASVKQKIQVSFTPAVTGLVNLMVTLRKASTTVWINPKPVIA